MTGRSAHTALPWKQSLPDEILIVGPGNEDVAQMSGHYQTEYVAMEANAAFIVRACNSHYELLEACNKVVNNWGNLHPKDLAQLHAAIAKAEART